MTDFAAFQFAPGAALPPAWLDWLAATLRGTAEVAPQGGAFPPSVPPSPIPNPQSPIPALDAHGLSPLLYLALRDGPAGRLWPPSALAALAEAFQTNALRSFLMGEQLDAIVRALASRGIPVALLKGAAMGRTVYDSPAARLVNDLDLLIPSDRVDEARAALLGLGYRAAGPAGRGRLGRWQRRYRAELQMVGAAPGREGLLVEFHWSLVELPYLIDRIPMAEVWASARPCPGLPGALLPDAATLLLHACAHVALHHSRSLRLIWLVDIDRLARWAELDWAAVADRATRWGLSLAVQEALGATAAWLGTPVPPAAAAQLAEAAADPVVRSQWGLGDELPGGARRRARATWAAFSWPQRGRYAGWLALRAAMRPLERLRDRAAGH